MHFLPFTKSSYLKPTLKLSALSVMVAALSGCGENFKDCNGFWDKTFGRDACTAVAGVNQVTLTGTAIDDPISGAMLKVTTLDGKEIGTATTQADGTFAVSVPEPYLVDPILLQVSGGTMAGQPFTGTLKAIYTPQDGRTGLNLTPVTTLVSHLAASETGSDLVAKRNAALNKLVALGMMDLQNWRKVADTPFDLGTIAFRISDLGGVTPWLNTIQTDIADGELSKDEMMMGFPKAHGGVQKVVVGMDTLSMAVGDKRQLQVSADGLPENTALTVTLENAPEWVKVSNGVVVFDVPENAQAGVRQSFNVVVSANGVPVGRKKALSVYVTPMTLLLEGSLGVAGGKIENQWKDIALSAPVGALKQQYTFKYYAGVDDGGQILFRSKNTPQMTEEESAQVDLIQPSPDILKKTT
ncbi:MAG: hypothetical protein IPI79_02790 [Moraxellaceae bacterium]|nr:hypothetical protein [Moraxellaceae bacterium]